MRYREARGCMCTGKRVLEIIFPQIGPKALPLLRSDQSESLERKHFLDICIFLCRVCVNSMQEQKKKKNFRKRGASVLQEEADGGDPIVKSDDEEERRYLFMLLYSMTCCLN